MGAGLLRGRYIIILTLPAIAFLLAVFVYPVSWMLLRSVSFPSWGTQNFAALLEHPVYLHVLWNTVVISGSVTLCCAALGYPLAYTMANSSAPVRRILVFVVLIPFWTSILVRSFAWMVLLQRQGLVNQVLLGMGIVDQPLALIYNRLGSLIGMTQILLPFMIFPLYSVMVRIDRIYAQAASVLGAGPVRCFFRIYLPLSVPGLMAGSTLVFIVSLGYFITPALLGGPRDAMVAQVIQQQIANLGNWGLAGALAVLLLLGTAMILGLMHRLFGVRDLWGAP